MSSSKSVLQTEITSLKATLAERDAQIAALTAAAAAAAAAPAEAPAKKQRKPRDPSKPVMLSPYLVFCAAQRAAHTGPTKLSVKELGVAWKLLSDEQRLSYKAEPAPVKPAKTPKTPKAPKTPKTPKTKKTRDPDAPKKPLSGFMLFSKQQRDAHTGEEKLTAKLLGERWNALTDAEKGAFKSS
jgi:high mobility group protein B1